MNSNADDLPIFKITAIYPGDEIKQWSVEVKATLGRHAAMKAVFEDQLPMGFINDEPQFYNGDSSGKN